MSGASYKDLLVWQKAMDLTESVYTATKDWPRDEMYGLTNQVRRAAVSVAANIAEGQGRHSVKEFLHHLSIANGSLFEVETHVLIAQRLRYFDSDTCEALTMRLSGIGRMLHGLMRSLR